MRFITQSISFVLPEDHCVNWLRNGPYATQVIETYCSILATSIQCDFDELDGHGEFGSHKQTQMHTTQLVYHFSYIYM